MIDLLRKKRNKMVAYQNCFCDATGKNLTLDGQKVLKDLMQFCSVNASTAYQSSDGKIDPIRMAFEEGRRTVFNRIKYYLTLSEADFQRLKS